MGSEPERHADSSLVLEDRLQGKPLESVRTSFIKPSSATPSEKEWLSLSKLDLMFAPFYTPILCTFTLTDHKFGSVERVVQHLKDSLADALVLFYPLAGRVVTKDGPPRIYCNDAGAVFTEASVDVELAELRTDDFQPQPRLSGLAAAGLGAYPALPQMEGGLPALIIQVTRFKCGGITLAANWAHIAADGQSGLHFMKSWSELARGLEVSLLPDHRRELVKPRKCLASNNPFKASVISAGALTIDPLKSKAETGEGRLQREESRIEAKIIEFTKDDIAKLKKQAAEQDPSVQLSRADCLSTHLWRTIARVRNLDTSGRARLIYLVEGRKRLSLPEGYFGNVIGFKTIITTVEELVNGAFGSTASLIHSAIPTVTAEWFQDLIDFMHLLQPGRNMFAEDGISPDYNFGVSYLIRFPFYDLDFGFGPPTHSMRNTMGARDGLVFVVPSSHGPEHMVAMANLNPQLMPKFLSMAHDNIPQ